MRVYLPATLLSLSALQASGEIGDAPITAFAVTPGLREWYIEDEDVDELEYAAFAEAARASLRLLGTAFGAPSRRAVLSADVPEDQVEVRDDLDRGVVRISAAVPAAAIASVHLDDADAAVAVAAAVAAIDQADLGDEAAQETVDDAEGFELSWYAPQELEQLIADARPSPS
ncbi:MAG: hypothetical protein JWN61_1872 [Pseudonocardiales bacterium]|nr:hypothetical protein [Pseudonocardiales bacterium]